MMEKSSEVVLTEHEKDQILGRGSLTKTAGERNRVPTRFEGWYSKEELEKIANEQD